LCGGIFGDPEFRAASDGVKPSDPSGLKVPTAGQPVAADWNIQYPTPNDQYPRLASLYALVSSWMLHDPNGISVDQTIL